MKDQNNSEDKNLNSPGDMANPGRGQQGIDKAPGEETPQDSDTTPVVYETQKGKNKVDGDPSQESDQPIDINKD